MSRTARTQVSNIAIKLARDERKVILQHLTFLAAHHVDALQANTRHVKLDAQQWHEILGQIISGANRNADAVERGRLYEIADRIQEQLTAGEANVPALDPQATEQLPAAQEIHAWLSFLLGMAEQVGVDPESLLTELPFSEQQIIWIASYLAADDPLRARLSDPTPGVAITIDCRDLACITLLMADAAAKAPADLREEIDNILGISIALITAGLAGEVTGREAYGHIRRRLAKQSLPPACSLQLTQPQRRAIAKLAPALSKLLALSAKHACRVTLPIDSAHRVLADLHRELATGTSRSTINLQRRAAERLSEALALSDPDLRIYQFRVHLPGTEPLVWRRFQTRNCSLYTLHEIVQAAMGWEAMHAYAFQIEGVVYDGMNDENAFSMEETHLDDVVPPTGKRFAFKYVYELGDSWEHELLFEGFPPLDQAAIYPVCLEGERDCPQDSVEFNPDQVSHAMQRAWNDTHVSGQTP